MSHKGSRELEKEVCILYEGWITNICVLSYLRLGGLHQQPAQRFSHGQGLRGDQALLLRPQPTRYRFTCVYVGVCVFAPLLIQRLHSHTFLGFHVNRVSPNRRLDHSVPLHNPKKYPGGSLEPAQLYQNPGGEPAAICRWLVDHTRAWVAPHVYVMV